MVKKEKVIISDMDDTIFSFTKMVCELHNKLHSTSITDRDVITWDFEGLDISDARGKRVTGADLQSTFKLFEDHGLYAVLPLLDYSGYALAIARSIGYKVILLTARDEKYKIQTELNLLQNDLQYDEIYYHVDKVKIIKELSKKYEIVLFVDDKFSTVKAVSENCKVKKCCLISKPHNKDIDLSDLDILKVNDLMDCIKELKKVNK